MRLFKNYDEEIEKLQMKWIQHIQEKLISTRGGILHMKNKQSSKKEWTKILFTCRDS